MLGCSEEDIEHSIYQPTNALNKFSVRMIAHRNKFLYNKTNQMHQFSQIFSGMKLYMFRSVPLPIIRSLFTVH